MDLFKKASNKLATSLDWNCPHITKRRKNDTRLIHQQARTKLKNLDKKIILEVLEK